EARMRRAEVVDSADQIHSHLPRGGAPGQGPAPAGQGRQTRAQGGREPCNVGGGEAAPPPPRPAAGPFPLRGPAPPHPPPPPRARPAAPPAPPAVGQRA